MGEIQVIHRNGQITGLDISKIREVVKWACEGLEVDPICLESGLTTRLRDGITTREIQENLIDCAVSLSDIENPDWRYVAGRLVIWNHLRDTQALRERCLNISGLYGNGNLAKFIEWKKDSYSIDERIDFYSPEEIEEAETWINPELDKDYDYAGAVLLTQRYLGGDELPQEMYVLVSLLLATVEPDNKMYWARQFYEAFATRKISLATPFLANLRIPNKSFSSCFVSAVEDDLESIFDAAKDLARISKNGGGVGLDISRIRAAGSWVMGNEKASGGVIPWIKIYNDTALAVNQGGKRAGSVTIALEIWHLDIPDFLEMQTEHGDQRRKAFDVFPQLVIPDEFMKRVENDEMWTLVDPYEVRTKLGFELCELWGERFEEKYRQIESSLDKEITLYKKVKAKELYKQVLRSRLETGMPYLWFKDTVNRANPNKHSGYIPSGNLCVVGETKVLTDRGEFPIYQLVGKEVNVWNGEQWSKTVPFQTGENQPLLGVLLKEKKGSSIKSLVCTPEHKFYAYIDFTDQIIQTEARYLSQGQRLMKYCLPGSEEEVELEVISVSLLKRREKTYCFTEPLRHMGVFNGILTGQCQESFSNVKPRAETHCCNLMSLNLANIKDNELAEMCHLAVRALDNSIELTTPPIESALNHNNRYRTIGVGAMGLADWLALRKLKYQNLQEINDLFEDIAFFCTEASSMLAKERGEYAAFEGSEWSKGLLLGSKSLEEIKEYSSNFDRWKDLAMDVQLFGIRNSQITAIAPNTSSSLFQGCTASILPTYARFHDESNGKGAIPKAPPFINDRFWYYQENRTLDQNVVVEAVAVMQRWIDTGISMELLFNLNEGIYGEGTITAKDIFEIDMNAWRLGIKAVYYTRTVQQDNFRKEDCPSCAN